MTNKSLKRKIRRTSKLSIWKHITDEYQRARNVMLAYHRKRAMKTVSE